MEKAKATKEDIEKLQSELDSLKEELSKKIEGIRTTMAVLQDEESMKNIQESEENRKKGLEVKEFEY